MEGPVEFRANQKLAKVNVLVELSVMAALQRAAAAYLFERRVVKGDVGVEVHRGASAVEKAKRELQPGDDPKAGVLMVARPDNELGANKVVVTNAKSDRYVSLQERTEMPNRRRFTLKIVNAFECKSDAELCAIPMMGSSSVVVALVPVIVVD